MGNYKAIIIYNHQSLKIIERKKYMGILSIDLSTFCIEQMLFPLSYIPNNFDWLSQGTKENWKWVNKNWPWLDDGCIFHSDCNLKTANDYNTIIYLKIIT